MEGVPKMLVVDNKADLARLAEQTSRGTFEVVLASDREEALQKVNLEMPALVILGSLELQNTYLEFCKELREASATKDMKILVVDPPLDQYSRRTGWKKSEGLQMETDGYVSRPVESTGLKEAITNWPML